MLTKTLLALSLIAGSTIAIASYSQSANFQITSLNPLQTVTQLPQQEIDSIARNITVKVRNAENEGSGIIIAKDDDTYTIITNASLTDGENYTIQTPDGMKHEAIVTGDNTENDLAVLEFTSNEQYQIATIGNSNSITEGETVIAAGFPESTEELLVTEGKISLLTEKPLNKGYSIGFTNETVQGMSGGVLLNANGEVIGILGKGKGAILDTAYDYADGTTPSSDEIATFREVAFSIPIQNIANLSPQLAALVPGESNPEIAQQPEYTGIVKTVDDIAQQITVRIATAEIPSYGSGVIIAKDGNTYYVATVAHNFPEGTTDSYQIVTSDGESHTLDLNTVKKSDAYDFALFSFTSDNDYTVATIGNYTVAANHNQTVFVSGFPGMYAPTRIITGGKVREQDIISFATKDSSTFISTTTDRPGLLYSNISYKGMSGGAVLDIEGRLTGINTGAENELYFDDEGNNSEIAIGFSLGIPLTDVLTFIDRETPLKTEWLQTTNNPSAKVSDNDYSSIEEQLLTVEAPKDNDSLAQWMNYGNQLWRYGRFDEAVSAFERVIAINPDYDRAYYAMGLTYLYKGNNAQKAVISLEKATQINPKSYFYWRYLGFSYRELKQYDLALAAYDKVINQNPEDFILYVERGDVLHDSQNYQDAIVSYSEAIKINSQHPWSYNNRGNTYYESKQYQQAVADYNQAIEINPNFADAYHNRGLVYYDLQQYQQAISDYNKAIEINPNFALAYNGRGNTYIDLQQYQQAISDFTKAIEINPQFPDAYVHRGVTYYILQQYQQAIGDYNKAIEINPNFALAYSNRGLAYYDLQQYQQALDDLNKALEINPQYADAYLNRGITYADLQQYQQAINDYNKAIEINPQLAQAYYNRGVTYYESKQYQQAVADFTKAIEINPQYANAYLVLGGVYIQLNDIEAARTNLEKARQLFIAQNNIADAEYVASVLEQLP